MKRPLIFSESEIDDILRDGTCEHRVPISKSNGQINSGDKLFIGMTVQLEVTGVKTDDAEYVFSFKLVDADPFAIHS